MSQLGFRADHLSFVADFSRFSQDGDPIPCPALCEPEPAEEVAPAVGRRRKGFSSWQPAVEPADAAVPSMEALLAMLDEE